ncbi:MAG TPA: PKD domain-containing protein, partial [Thermoplasmata archaeon]
FEYIGLASCSDSPLVQGKLLKVDLRGNHSVVGEFDFAPNGKIGGTIWSTSAVDEATGTIWVATGNEGGANQPYADAIVALHASDMSLIGWWQIPGLVGTDEDFGSGPTLFHDAAGRELVVANDKNGVAYALNRSNVTTNGSWAPVWEAPTGDVYAPLAFDGTSLYSGGTGATIQGHFYPSTLVALNPATGAVEWTAGLVGDAVYGAPVYANGLVVVGAGSDLEVVNATDGTLLADVTLSTTGETIDGSPCVVNGRIFVGTGNFGTSGHLFELGIPLSVNGTPHPSNQTPDGWLGFAASPAGGAPPYSFAWQFGDGGNGTGTAPVHAYASAGTYSVVVFVTDSTGTVSNATFPAVVARSPQPMTATVLASPPVGLAPFATTLQATVLVGGGAPYQLSWDFGDGSTAGGSSDWNESHVYPLIGSYSAHFQAIDRWGRGANTTADVLVVSPLLLAITRAPASGTAPLDVTLHAFVSGGSAPGTVFWQFGDGSAATSGNTADHTFSVAGEYIVSAEVRDALGEDVSQNVTISVLAGPGGPAPLAAVATATLVGVDCTNNATVVNVIGDATGGAAPYGFAWDFGDGSPTIAGSTASHAYALVGSYIVTLNVTDADGVSALNGSSVAI